MKQLSILIVATVATLAAHSAHAINLAEYDIEPRFRAKLVKEKAKQNATRTQFADAEGDDKESCGSQNIGNVNTGGRPGTTPREVFVFAPNAINMVTARGCQ